MKLLIAFVFGYLLCCWVREQEDGFFSDGLKRLAGLAGSAKRSLSPHVASALENCKALKSAFQGMEASSPGEPGDDQWPPKKPTRKRSRKPSDKTPE